MSATSSAEPQLPLLRWAGSKRTLLPVLAARIPRNYGRYVEPFAGSACLFFAVAPPSALLSDYNVDLMHTYGAVRDQPRGVADALATWTPTSDCYYRVRAMVAGELDEVTRAARFIYLNRLCFNGVYRTNRKGQFNVPFGTRTAALPDERRLTGVSDALRGVDLRCADFAETLDATEPSDFVYLDPPYSRAARDAYGMYGYDGFTGADLQRLLDALADLDRRGIPFMLSYRDSQRLRHASARWRVETVAVHAQVGGRATARSTRAELLVTNF